MIEELSKESASTDKLLMVESQSTMKSPRHSTRGFKLGSSFENDNMSDSGLGSGSELFDAVPGPLLSLLVNIHQFVVIIEDHKFECSTYPFVLKSSYFKNSIQDFKKSRQERPIPEIPLVLPGGRQTFELIRIFCYDSKVPITKKNVLNLLTASNSLGFTEDVAPHNLHSRCMRFIEEERKNHGVQGIMSILAHSTSDDATDCDLLINKLAEENCNLLINELAEHALAFQNSDDDNAREIVELLSELRKLHPRFVDATLREFGRLGVNMVDFFWCTELSTHLDVLLGSNEDSQTYGRSIFTNGRSIFSYFSEALDKCIAAGEVQVDRVDPKKLATLLNPGVFRRPMQSEDAIRAYVSSKLSQLNAEDILDLHPGVVRDLVSTAVSASRDSMLTTEEMQHLAGLVDRALVSEAEINPWDGSTDSKKNFKEIAECVSLNERESHDMFYGAVQSFSQSFTQEEAEDIWNMVDLDKLSEAKFEAAINFTLLHRDHYYVRLLQRRQDDHLSLKRRLSVLEENESKRQSRWIPDYCGTLFTVFVRSLDGTLSSLLVESDTTVNIIKEAIAKTHSIHPERFWWLVYRGKKLLESHTIASYGIKKDCTLYIKVLLTDRPEREFLELFPATTSDSTEVFIGKTPCVCG